MARTKRIIKCDCEDDIPSLEEQFRDIMNNFDFKHVNMMMNWEYARADYNDEGECVGIGTHKELLKTCEVYKEIALSQLSEEELKDA